MTIATFNINNVNKRLPNLLAWLAARKPDIVCLQELKAADNAFPEKALADAGYGAVWQAQKTWNGVAILARGSVPVLTRTRLPGDVSDDQARYVEAAVQGILVASLYLPNGNPQPGPKFDYKIAWFKRLQAHAATLLAAKVPVVLAGDYNVAPTDLDIYRTTSWTNDALLHPQSRLAFAELVAQGWTDALRARHGSRTVFTFWHYMRQRWPRDAGLRLDHLLLSPELAGCLADAGVDREIRGHDNASDHAPAWIRLGPASAAGRARRRAKA
ncbi:exodeoxyribonuclease III [Bosea sp. AAP35]|uniref:exodeoxyribonuclease III n=1 Tax=Bosea sp. AAP35 TaxID=1523417 RepID=UPI0006B8ABED|nr:exodeoxyribonuclease III [Bosea sp. AAP35]KPF67681.1 exodeoxyribonuclease III [Bosea sp. AAP35]